MFSMKTHGISSYLRNITSSNNSSYQHVKHEDFTVYVKWIHFKMFSLTFFLAIFAPLLFQNLSLKPKIAA